MSASVQIDLTTIIFFFQLILIRSHDTVPLAGRVRCHNESWHGSRPAPFQDEGLLAETVLDHWSRAVRSQFDL